MGPPIKAKITASNDHIPLHVVEEILLRLDSQTQFQCSFVCRDWNNVITNPDFIRRSSARTFGLRNQILLIKVCHCEESVERCGRQYIHFPHCRVTYSLHMDNDQFDLLNKTESPPAIDDKGAGVIGVSNGLVCLATKLPFDFILWNPTVRKYVCLPPTMNWDESLSRAGFGFGFDTSNNDFKVINIVHRLADEFSDHEFDSAWVFSYVTWSWKRLTCSILHSCSTHRNAPHVLFNGKIHWMSRNREERYTFILTFDLTREVFGKILLPSATHPSPMNSIVTTGDSLLLIRAFHYEYLDEDEYVASYFFSIWAMKEYGNDESWTNTSLITTKMDYHHILGARKNGDLILEMEGGHIRRFNPTSPIDVLAGAMKNSVFFRYHTESLYLLEKVGDVNSY